MGHHKNRIGGDKRDGRSGRHLAKTSEYGSVLWMADGARHIMGAIDLDPASSPIWNRTIRATRILTRRDNALRAAWAAEHDRGRVFSSVRVFLNPPGDPTGSLVPRFWRRLIDEWTSGVVECAVWIGFSIEQFRTLQGAAAVHPLELPMMIPAKRVPYNVIERDRIVPSKHPSHATYLTFLPPRSRVAARPMLARWCDEFGSRGMLHNCKGR